MRPDRSVLHVAILLLLTSSASCAPAETEAATRGDEQASAAAQLPPGWNEVPCRRDNVTRRRIPRSGGEVQRGIELAQFRVLPNSISDPGVAAVDFIVTESNNTLDVRVNTVPANVSFDPPLRVTMSYARCQSFALPRGHRLGVLRFRQRNWTELPILEHDTLQRTLLTESTHVSRFVVATRLSE